jgi:histidinol dehydrogenase
MNAIPAIAAGVKRVVMVVPTPEGIISPAVLVAARIAGVSEIYRIGGAQAVAGLAFGTGTIPKVDKIAGPGNAYVAEAKRQLYGVVGIDSIAGPSEILVVADDKNNPEWVAADMLSQAEHDKQASSILITDSADFAAAVAEAVAKQIAALPRREIAEASISNHGVIIIVGDIAADAPAIIDHIAPEHLELMVDEPASLMAAIKHAGAFFLGRHTPEALGDYLAGPSHVLPTSGTARFSSGLSVMDFMKRSSVIGAPPAAMAALRAATEILAAAEGLQAHGLSAKLRGE